MLPMLLLLPAALLQNSLLALMAFAQVYTGPPLHNSTNDLADRVCALAL
jgi:hypothetical protein